MQEKSEKRERAQARAVQKFALNKATHNLKRPRKVTKDSRIKPEATARKEAKKPNS